MLRRRALNHYATARATPDREISFQHANPGAGNEAFLLRFPGAVDGPTPCVLVDAGEGTERLELPARLREQVDALVENDAYGFSDRATVVEAALVWAL